MNVKKLPVWIVSGFVVASAVAAVQAEDIKVGQPAPDFTLTSVDGKEYKLSDLKGQVVVLEWTNHQCPFVKRHQGEKKTMQSTFKKFEGKPVVWFGVDSSHFAADKKSDIMEWTKQANVNYPILLDPEGTVGKAYGAKTTPHMFVIDQKGNLAYTGAIDDDRMGESENPTNYVAQAIEALLDGSTVATAETKPYGCSVKYKG